MQNEFDRRSFLKTTAAAGMGIALANLGGGRIAAADVSLGAPHDAKDGWQLAVAAYSFNKYPFYKTVDLVAELGLNAVEGFTWQPLSEAKAGVQTNEALSAGDRREMKARLADKGVKLVGCDCNLPRGSSPRKTFEWAKDMGIEYLVAEPAFDAYETIDKLCDEYQVRMAVHNHPKPNPYWNPDVLLKHLQGRGPRLGACCDTGHWVRSGLDPVEMLKKLQGHVVSFHLKDIAKEGKEAGCVPFGTGRGQIGEILREAQRQQFKGVFAIEYEPFSPESFANVAKCVVFFEKYCRSGSR